MLSGIAALRGSACRLAGLTRRSPGCSPALAAPANPHTPWHALSARRLGGGSLLARSRKNAAGPVGGSGAVAGGEDEPDWKMYSLTGAGSKNSCTVMTADGFEINSDTPKNTGGTNHAPQPVYLLLAALAGCETATAHYVARQMRIRVHGVAFDLRGWRDQRGALCRPLEAIDTCEVPSHLQVIEGTAAVDTEATQEQIDELAHQVHRRCPIASMLIASGCRLDIKWVKATPG